ncbi:hypothetical protein GALL_515040 [mine drainage metagenome]|uniref:DUF2293 domain-containing protein n=1 Tax=mine drainage metagenome TaxID=410659 RepID=A0A1J5PNS3_9ZZZZ
MIPKNRAVLADRVAKAAEASLAAQNYVCAIDVLMGIGWLDPGAVKRWRQGQVDYLERMVHTNLSRISEAMKSFRSWATAKGLNPSETAYVARLPGRPALRFSKSGNPTIERLYRTHWVAPELSEKKRERLAEKANQAPELVVIQPLNHEWTCHRCNGTGDLLIMENQGPACLRCAGLGDLEFLSAGDAKLTRLAKAKSEKWAVVVRFSRTRRRYERQGLLVERQALTEAQHEIGKKNG